MIKRQEAELGDLKIYIGFILGVTKMIKISIEHIREAANVNSLETNVKRQGWDGLDACRGGKGAMLDI